MNEITARPDPNPVPCESVTTCRQPSAWILTNRAGTEFHLCQACARAYLEDRQREAA